MQPLSNSVRTGPLSSVTRTFSIKVTLLPSFLWRTSLQPSKPVGTEADCVRSKPKHNGAGGSEGVEELVIASCKSFTDIKLFVWP